MRSLTARLLTVATFVTVVIALLTQTWPIAFGLMIAFLVWASYIDSDIR